MEALFLLSRIDGRERTTGIKSCTICLTVSNIAHFRKVFCPKQGLHMVNLKDFHKNATKVYYMEIPEDSSIPGVMDECESIDKKWYPLKIISEKRLESCIIGFPKKSQGQARQENRFYFKFPSAVNWLKLVQAVPFDYFAKLTSPLKNLDILILTSETVASWDSINASVLKSLPLVHLELCAEYGAVEIKTNRFLRNYKNLLTMFWPHLMSVNIGVPLLGNRAKEFLPIVFNFLMVHPNIYRDVRLHYIPNYAPTPSETALEVNKGPWFYLHYLKVENAHPEEITTVSFSNCTYDFDACFRNFVTSLTNLTVMRIVSRNDISDLRNIPRSIILGNLSSLSGIQIDIPSIADKHDEWSDPFDLALFANCPKLAQLHLEGKDKVSSPDPNAAPGSFSEIVNAHLLPISIQEFQCVRVWISCDEFEALIQRLEKLEHISLKDSGCSHGLGVPNYMLEQLRSHKSPFCMELIGNCVNESQVKKEKIALKQSVSA